MVNHLWIEDTYARWKVMTLTNPKYTHFPRRTNLQEVVGQTRIDLDALVPFYHYDADSPEPAVATAAAGAGGVSAAADPGGNGATKSMVSRLAVTNLGTPAPATRRKREGEDSPAPPSTGSRKAKEMAIARLHEQATGSSGRSRKRPKSADVSGGDDDGDDDDGRAHKKSKKRPKPAIFLLITAYTGWLDKPHKEDDEKVCPIYIEREREQLTGSRKYWRSWGSNASTTRRNAIIWPPRTWCGQKSSAGLWRVRL